MTALAQDFVKGLDLTVQPSVNGADINQIMDAGVPATDKGLIVTTTDSGSTPDVPNATTTTKWQRYLWRRARNSGLSPILYYWNPNATSDATYLKWQAVSGSSTSAGALTFANYAALRAYDFASLVTSQVSVFVLGYAAAGDGGFGEFRLDTSDTSSADNDGSILVTTTGSYRFKRNAGSFFYPEWFGAKVNDATYKTANTAAIRKCIAYNLRVQLSVGTYYISNDLRVSSGVYIRGVGKGVTTLKVSDANADVALRGPNGEWFSVIETNTAASARVGDVYGLPYAAYANNVTIEDLSIDGNYDNQTKDGSNRFLTTVKALRVVGSNVRYNNVSAKQCAVGYSNGAALECFVFQIATDDNQGEAVGGVVTGCSFTNPGSLGDISTYGGTAGREITVIGVAAGANLQPSGVRIESNYIYDVNRTNSTQTSPLNALSTSRCLGAVVAHNVVKNFDGRGFYCDNSTPLGYASVTTRNLTITGNVFDDVAAGVWLQTIQNSLYKDVLVSDNIIRLYNNANQPGYLLNVPPIGVMLYYNGLFTWAGSYHMERVVVRDNVISGGGDFAPTSGVNNYFSRGVYLQFANGDVYDKVAVVDNTIDVPQFGPASPAYYYQEADSLAVYSYLTDPLFSNQQRGVRGNGLTFRGNRTPTGKSIYMTTTDAAFLANFKYFQDDGCIIDLTTDPLNATASSLLDYAFARNVDQSWFNSGYKRLWKAQDTRKVVASGSLVPGRTYCVQTDDGNASDKVVYNSTDVFHNGAFNCVAGYTGYTATGYAKVYESPAYNWQPLTRNSVEIYSVNSNTYPIYGIENDRFLDTRFFVQFAAFNSDCKIALPDPASVDNLGNKVYKGRTCFIRYGRGSITDAHEIILACGTVAAGVLTPLTGKLVDPIACTTVDEVVLTPASKGALGGIVGLLCDGDYWFITSQISDPQEILLYTQIGTTATTPNDFELTNHAAAPFYHNLSTNLKDRQLKGLVYCEFPLTGDARLYLPDPASFPGYQAKYCMRVGSGFATSIYCGTFASPLTGKLINPGLSGNKGEIVNNCVVSGTEAVARLITVEVTSTGSYWLIICN